MQSSRSLPYLCPHCQNLVEKSNIRICPVCENHLEALEASTNNDDDTAADTVILSDTRIPTSLSIVLIVTSAFLVGSFSIVFFIKEPVLTFFLLLSSLALFNALIDPFTAKALRKSSGKFYQDSLPFSLRLTILSTLIALSFISSVAFLPYLLAALAKNLLSINIPSLLLPLFFSLAILTCVMAYGIVRFASINVALFSISIWGSIKLGWSNFLKQTTKSYLRLSITLGITLILSTIVHASGTEIYYSLVIPVICVIYLYLERSWILSDVFSRILKKNMEQLPPTISNSNEKQEDDSEHRSHNKS